MSLLSKFAESQRVARLKAASRTKSARSNVNDILLLYTADHLNQKQAVKKYSDRISRVFQAKLHLVEITTKPSRSKDFYSYKKITPTDFDIWGNVKVKNYNFLLSKVYSWVMNFDLYDQTAIHDFTLQIQSTSALGISDRYSHLYDIVIPSDTSKELADYFEESLDIFDKMI